ncbi:uncharacterized protein LOC117220477 isoform X2 [Megalopta genalis]|uniref:uncharacterized protein LOC117220477 isoform X2 n=1 Tax=Megalopta genalis TaxID=115081 RepID=UPI001442F67B|nr:uncharacterized protein LOC117220477 isoform X2 [Megalopta genalis]
MENKRYNFANLPTTNQDAIVWAREHRLLRGSMMCRVHRKPMKFHSSSAEHGIGRFRCSVGRANCRQYSAMVDSFFEHIRLPLYKAIRLMYCFTRDLSYAYTTHELCDFNVDTDHVSTLSSSTIAAWFRYCREMIVDHFPKMQLDKPKLGGISAAGKPVTIQIDEAKFGKRKCNRGRNVEGHWIIGMVDVETTDCRMVVMENRTPETIIDVIKEYIAIGSEIQTDRSRIYEGLTAAGYVHKTVNHSIEKRWHEH